MRGWLEILKGKGTGPFVPGQGRISGYISCTLGILSLLAVFCFMFPELLTTKEFRQAYTESFARNALLAGMALSIIFGIFSILRGSRYLKAIIGIACSAIAFTLGGANIQFDTIAQAPYSLGLDWFILALLGSALIFIPLEKMFSKNPEQHILRPHWRTDMTYFFVSHMLVQFILIFVTASSTFLIGWAISSDFQKSIQEIPIVLQFILAVFLADLGQYWLHRLYHTLPWLWKLHAIHHSSTAMDWLAGSRTHFIEVLLTRTAVLMPLIFMGFSQEALNAYVILVGVQAVLAHANIAIPASWLDYILVLPRYHHWHHAKDPAYIYKNYAIHLPIVDFMFGTQKLPPKIWPEKYGAFGKPLPHGIVQQHLSSFKKNK
jgi:sterol desaturase/sphingolipid hydroxylase (fatty acid hydroxylase superfamily)